MGQTITNIHRYEVYNCKNEKWSTLNEQDYLDCKSQSDVVVITPTSNNTVVTQNIVSWSLVLRKEGLLVQKEVWHCWNLGSQSDAPFQIWWCHLDLLKDLQLVPITIPASLSLWKFVWSVLNKVAKSSCHYFQWILLTLPVMSNSRAKKNCAHFLFFSLHKHKVVH